MVATASADLQSTASDPLDALLRESFERQRRAVVAAQAPKPVPRPVSELGAVRSAPAAAPVREPLTAAATVDEVVVVKGPLSAAQLRRSVDRVRSTLSDCYGGAARRAGHNRFSQVRVGVTIDEVGRVKMRPTVEGATLPGFAACVQSAMSKLVCQAPDTGIAKASITLGFRPDR